MRFSNKERKKVVIKIVMIIWEFQNRYKCLWSFHRSINWLHHTNISIRVLYCFKPVVIYQCNCGLLFIISISSLAQKAKADALQTTRKGIGIPADWEPMTLPYHFKRVLLSPDSNGMMQREYKMVAKKINKTLSHARILQIERVQNEYSWETYQL